MRVELKEKLIMSKINCNVAGDLIPLYVDEVLTPDSVELVEEHLAECEECTAKVESLRKETVIAADKDVKPLEKIKRKVKINKWAVISIIAVVVLLSVFITAFFIKPIYFDISYNSVKDKITVISGSDLPVQKEGHDAVILYDGKENYDAFIWENVIGEKNGVKQVEVTLYMARWYQSYREYYDNKSGSYKYNGKARLYVIHSFEYADDKFGCNAYDEYESSGGYYISDSHDEAQGGEIVAVYYGKWDDNNGSGKPKVVGERHLLWSKK